MVWMAAVVVFRDEHSLLGALHRRVRSMGAAAGGICARSWGWSALQRRPLGLAFLAAALVYGRFRRLRRARRCTRSSWCFRPRWRISWSVWSLLLLSYVIEGTSSWREVLAEFASGRSRSPAVRGRSAFSSGGCTCRFGPAVMLLHHRADVHRPRDVRVVHPCEGIARRDGGDADPRARGKGPVHRRVTPSGSPSTRATSAKS